MYYNTLVKDRLFNDTFQFIDQELCHFDQLNGNGKFVNDNKRSSRLATLKNEALKLAERIRKNISMHDFPTIDPFTVSIGHTEFHAGDSSYTLLKRVDNALYQAKNSGRNNVTSC